MNQLRKFEIDVLERLLKPVLEEDLFRAIIQSGVVESFERSGVGYFLVLSHPRLPGERVVCREPVLVGRLGGIEVGFVAFIDSGRVTLECHSWGQSDVPDDIRDEDVEILVTPCK